MKWMRVLSRNQSHGPALDWPLCFSLSVASRAARSYYCTYTFASAVSFLHLTRSQHTTRRLKSIIQMFNCILRYTSLSGRQSKPCGKLMCIIQTHSLDTECFYLNEWVTYVRVDHLFRLTRLIYCIFHISCTTHYVYRFAWCWLYFPYFVNYPAMN